MPRITSACVSMDPLSPLRECTAGGSLGTRRVEVPRDDNGAYSPRSARIFASSRRARASMSEGATPLRKRSTRHQAG